MESTSQTAKVNEFSQEFKLEMENSICNYFEKCHLDSPQLNNKKSGITRDETLIDNANQGIEYITPKTTPSLKGISEFMIDQIFSTDKIIPIYDSSDEENENKIKTENVNNKETVNDVNQKKMSTCNSDVTLNEEAQDLFEDEDVGNETISKSFAVEFIDLFEMNMKELKSKKDDFHVIGLKKIEEEKEEKVEEKQVPEVKIKEEFLEEKPKTSKKSKHISLFNSLDRKSSTRSIRLHRSKSTNSKPSKHSDEDSDTKSKKSKSKLGFSKIFRSVKKRMSQNLL